MKLCVIFVLSTVLPANSVCDVCKQARTEKRRIHQNRATQLLALNQFFSPVVYKWTRLTGCCDSADESEFFFSLNQNEIIYEDFKTKQQIIRQPPFTDPLDFLYLYDIAIKERNACLDDMKTVRAAVGSPPEVRGNKMNVSDVFCREFEFE